MKVYLGSGGIVPLAAIVTAHILCVSGTKNKMNAQ
jgi:hypothetical protein